MCIYPYYERIKKGFPLLIKKKIDCISRTVQPYKNFDEYLKLAENPDFRFVVSNTTESGIAFNEGDRPENAPDVTFPAKVTLLLKKRFDLGLKGFIFMPVRAYRKNGLTPKSTYLNTQSFGALTKSF